MPSFKLSDQIFQVEDQHLAYSPFLKALVNSQLPIDRDEAGHILLELDPKAFEQYCRFLTGWDFTLTKEVAAVFDYLGHHNHLDYPLDYWEVKLRDNWVRDNFYSLELWQKPLYGLIPLKRKRELPIKVPTGWYVAGGAALWLAGHIEELKDVDLFTCLPKEKAEQSLAFLNQDLTPEQFEQAYPDLYPSLMTKGQETVYRPSIAISRNSISYRAPNQEPVYQSERARYRDPFSTNTQFILRLYRSPSEIVHGFDLDCVGAVYCPETDKLYCTARTHYALTHRINFYDPARASPSYVYRLIKYRKRGFQLYLPLIDESELNEEAIDDYFNYISQRYFHNFHEGNWELLLDEVRGRLKLALDKKSRELVNVNGQQVLETVKKKVDRTLAGFKPYHPGPQFAMLRGGNYLDKEKVIDDPASLLILAAFRGFYPHVKPISDYESNRQTLQTWQARRNLPVTPFADLSDQTLNQWTEERKLETQPYYQKGNYRINFSLLKWHQQDPMTQVTNTFKPTPLSEEELLAWYRTSPFRQDYVRPVEDRPIKPELASESL